MKKLVYSLGIMAVLASCAKTPDPKFCWTCTQRYIYNSTDTTPTFVKRDTTKLCKLNQNEIDQHEASNRQQIYNTYTKDDMLCVRDQ